MIYTSCFISVCLIASVVSGNDGQRVPSPPPAQLEQTIEMIKQSMAETPAPWPHDWQREYVHAIRQAMATDPNALPTAWHLAALQQGFASYWQDLAKGQDRPSFEVQRAEIRWYVENLMSIAPNDEDQRRQLHDQYETLWDHAAAMLLTQFPFLDPAAVQAATADHVAHCHAYIDAPLVPLFVRPLTEQKVQEVKIRWHDLRYHRVDFWRQLGGKAILSIQRTDGAPLQTHPHYTLTHRSLDEWLLHIHTMAVVPPEHYLQAIRDQKKAQRRHRQLLSQARAAERRLERECHGQLRQTEYLSFLLAALLETIQELPPRRAPQNTDAIEGGRPHER
jgi:hypothetical protein